MFDPVDGAVKRTYRINFDQSPYTPFGGMIKASETTGKETAHVRCGASGNTDHRFATFQYTVRMCETMEGVELCGQPRLDIIFRGQFRGEKDFKEGLQGHNPPVAMGPDSTSQISSAGPTGVQALLAHKHTQ